MACETPSSKLWAEERRGCATPESPQSHYTLVKAATSETFPLPIRNVHTWYHHTLSSQSQLDSKFFYAESH